MTFASADNFNTDIDAQDCIIGCWENETWTPSECLGVISVGGLGTNSTRHAVTGPTSGSNFGTGPDGYGTVRIFGPYTVWIGHTPGAANVQTVSGTSYAAPFVAGIAALIWAADPTLNAEAVEQILLQTAHPGSTAADSVVRRWVNANAAVLQALGWHEQTSWKWCTNCNGLWFGGGTARGTCPANGQAHSSVGSGDYGIIIDTPTHPGQHGWRFCDRCRGMFWSGTRGACPLGGTHNPTGSGDYSISMVDSVFAQNDWRWRRKCSGLWFAGFGTRGACPAGQQHTADGSGNYTLPY